MSVQKIVIFSKTLKKQEFQNFKDKFFEDLEQQDQFWQKKGISFFRRRTFHVTCTYHNRICMHLFLYISFKIVHIFYGYSM